MTELAERLSMDSAQAASDVRFSYSRPEQPLFHRSVIRLIESLSGQRRLERLYRGWAARPREGENIFAAAIRLLDIAIDTDWAAWGRIPAEGPLLLVANHPFGVIDGLLIGHLATRIRPDVRIMTHSLLCQPPEARDYLLPVDFGGTAEARATSLLTRRRTLEWLAAGHCVAVFPGGGVATAQRPLTGPALEQPWHPFVGKLARQPGTSVVPVWFEGGNSRLFHVMSHTHYALRIALLFRETTRLEGARLSVRVGAPLSPADIMGLGGRDDVLAALRRLTHALAEGFAPDPAQAFRWPAHIDPD
jgi:putative hemolysin